MYQPSLKKMFFFGVVLLSVVTSAQTAPVRTLIDMETKANGAGIRSNEAVAMSHYEIPLRLLTEQVETGLSPKEYESLVFEKNGEKYVRWIVNPEDTKWFKDVETFMKKNGIDPVRKTYFKGYQTASRSYIAIDPVNGAQFSIKTSTNQTGGAWKDKKQDYHDGFDIMLISDLILRAKTSQKFENFDVLQEPLVFGIQEIDQSIVLRDLGALSTSEEFLYVPGFSVLHDKVGKEIALKNGSNDPYKFWEENYIKPMARSAAELIARTGVWFDSPHSQNFLVEMDKNMKPTGKIILRDLGDVYINEPILKAMGEAELLHKFSTKDNILTKLTASFGPLHGNKAPSWVSEAQYQKWGRSYAKTFSAEFEKRTAIKNMSYSDSWGFSYYGMNINTNSKEFLNFKDTLKAMPKWCAQLF